MQQIRLSLVAKALWVLAAISSSGFLTLPTALAGSKESHGGLAVVCKTKSGRLLSSELYDLFRANQNPRLKTSPSQASVKDQIESAILKIADPLVADDLRKEILNIFDKQVPINEGSYLINTGDNEPTIGKSGCTYEQVFTYYDSGDIDYVKPVLERMTRTHQAATYLHEALNALKRRQMRALNPRGESIGSTWAQPWVGLLFSGVEPASYQEKLAEEIREFPRPIGSEYADYQVVSLTSLAQDRDFRLRVVLDSQDLGSPSARPPASCKLVVVTFGPDDNHVNGCFAEGPFDLAPGGDAPFEFSMGISPANLRNGQFFRLSLNCGATGATARYRAAIEVRQAGVRDENGESASAPVAKFLREFSGVGTEARHIGFRVRH